MCDVKPYLRSLIPRSSCPSKVNRCLWSLHRTRRLRQNKRRRFAHTKLSSIPGLTCVNAKGAFYLFPNISGTGLKSADFCAKLLEQEKVAAVPGIAFGADDYIRLSYATSMANIEKGLDRLDKFCKALKK